MVESNRALIKKNGERIAAEITKITDKSNPVSVKVLT